MYSLIFLVVATAALLLEAFRIYDVPPYGFAFYATFDKRCLILIAAVWILYFVWLGW